MRFSAFLICWLGITMNISATPQPDSAQLNDLSLVKRQAIYGPTFQPPGIAPSAMQQTYDIRLQGNDSNCDFIALRNGIQNIGGAGDAAYATARTMISQSPRDYYEGFYTLKGPNGSDQRFSLDNLGAAAAAFIGVYQALGYNALLLMAEPDQRDYSFAQSIVDQLLKNPHASFAHAWITPREYRRNARNIVVPETNETVAMLYPYHEVAVFVDPRTPQQVIILDGLVGYPFALTLDTFADWLRGFNSVIMVSAEAGSIADHQRYQFAARTAPYVANRLGGPYLYAARKAFGSDYLQWGEVLGQPFRWHDQQLTKVVLPGTYVHYERVEAGPITLALLGTRMGYDLEAAGILPIGTIRPWEKTVLVNGIREWVIASFGSEQHFLAVFGNVLTQEIWLSQATMQQYVLRNIPNQRVDQNGIDGYIIVLTERAMIAWNAQQGTFLIPLGQIYDHELQRMLRP
ncbi:hypothetical protein [Herpetosiphon sp. NSE202]|uniref:hypothetical protein n=1 Tax=Herpetosiphon sp. NSE202 TaxID=3351349 RepID=UPI003634DB84